MKNTNPNVESTNKPDKGIFQTLRNKNNHQFPNGGFFDKSPNLKNPFPIENPKNDKKNIPVETDCMKDLNKNNNISVHSNVILMKSSNSQKLDFILNQSLECSGPAKLQNMSRSQIWDSEKFSMKNKFIYSEIKRTKKNVFIKKEQPEKNDIKNVTNYEDMKDSDESSSNSFKEYNYSKSQKTCQEINENSLSLESSDTEEEEEDQEEDQEEPKIDIEPPFEKSESNKEQKIIKMKKDLNDCKIENVKSGKSEYICINKINNTQSTKKAESEIDEQYQDLEKQIHKKNLNSPFLQEKKQRSKNLNDFISTKHYKVNNTLTDFIVQTNKEERELRYQILGNKVPKITTETQTSPIKKGITTQTSPIKNSDKHNSSFPNKNSNVSEIGKTQHRVEFYENKCGNKYTFLNHSQKFIDISKLKSVDSSASQIILENKIGPVRKMYKLNTLGLQPENQSRWKSRSPSQERQREIIQNHRRIKSSRLLGRYTENGDPPSQMNDINIFITKTSHECNKSPIHKKKRYTPASYQAPRIIRQTYYKPSRDRNTAHQYRSKMCNPDKVTEKSDTYIVSDSQRRDQMDNKFPSNSPNTNRTPNQFKPLLNENSKFSKSPRGVNIDRRNAHSIQNNNSQEISQKGYIINRISRKDTYPDPIIVPEVPQDKSNFSPKKKISPISDNQSRQNDLSRGSPDLYNQKLDLILESIKNLEKKRIWFENHINNKFEQFIKNENSKTNKPLKEKRENKSMEVNLHFNHAMNSMKSSLELLSNTKKDVIMSAIKSSYESDYKSKMDSVSQLIEELQTHYSKHCPIINTLKNSNLKFSQEIIK